MSRRPCRKTSGGVGMRMTQTQQTGNSPVGLGASRFSRALGRAAVYVALGVGVVVLVGVESKAALIPQGRDRLEYVERAQTLQGILVHTTTHFRRADGTLGSVRGSGIRFNDYKVGVAGHLATSTTATILSITVGDGLDYNLNPGRISEVPGQNIEVFPTYNRLTNEGIDFALLTLLPSQPLPGPINNIGIAQPGSVVGAGGFGPWGYSDSNLNPADGKAMFIEGRVLESAGLSLPIDIYDSFGFGFLNSGLEFNGRATGGYSGGSVVQWVPPTVGGGVGHWDIVGSLKAGTPDTSIFVDYGAPGFLEWSAPRIAAGIPEPAALSLVGLSALALRRQRVG